MTEAASHPNLDVVNRVYAAMADGDRETLTSLHHPDVVLHVSGEGPHAGDYAGRDAVLGLGEHRQEPRGPTTTEVHDILWSPEHVVVLLGVSMDRDGEHFTQNVVQVIHVEDEKITEIWEYLWDQHADQVFWSRH